MTKLAVAMLVASAAFAAPTFAQDSSITLRVDSGTVMTSAGGDYQSANTGKPVSVGEKVMVNAGSSATLVYDGGCTVSFTAPGVYEVPGSCSRAAAWNTGGNGKNAAIIIGTGVVIGALLNAEDNTDVGPLSNGVRHF